MGKIKVYISYQLLYVTHGVLKLSLRLRDVCIVFYIIIHTSSMVRLMLPTMVAPTAANEKKPYSHCPRSKTLSLRVKRPGIVLTAHGATVMSSPVWVYMYREYNYRNNSNTASKMS